MLCAVALVSIASSGPLSAQQSKQVAQEKAQAPADARRVSAPVTVTADGNLSVNVSRVRLGALLNEISALADLPIVVADVLVKDVVSFKLPDIPLDEGLKRLLAAYDAFYLFSASDKSPGSIKAVWVYARGEGRDLQPVPSSLWAGTKELEARLEDPDPGVRSDTYEQLIERQGERGLPTVLKGLADPDEDVRARTLSSAIDEDVEIPAVNLEALILDAQAQPQSVRVLALQAIQSKPEAAAIATSLINDPDDLVRNLARQILQRRPPPQR
jgi:type II secretory pathway component GspD/PulD (secretin)